MLSAREVLVLWTGPASLLSAAELVASTSLSSDSGWVLLNTADVFVLTFRALHRHLSAFGFLLVSSCWEAVDVTNCGQLQ